MKSKKLMAALSALTLGATMMGGMAMTASATDTTEGITIYESGVPVYTAGGTCATAQRRTVNNNLVYIDGNGDYTITNTGTTYTACAIGAFWSQYGGTPGSAYSTYGWHPAPHGMDTALISGNVTLNTDGTVDFDLNQSWSYTTGSGITMTGYITSIEIGSVEYTVDDDSDGVPNRVDDLPVDTDFTLTIYTSVGSYMGGTSGMTARFIVC